ncbi:MAG: putative Ig domain-containing protein [Nitrospirae bacterium]|nr:putative Ig domain-containing protein [Nitrospirota bacterium]
MPFQIDNKKIIRTSKGAALLYVIAFLFFFIISLMAAGIRYFGPHVFRAKAASTIDTLEKTVQAVISWSVAHNRVLPPGTTFPGIVPNPNDPYGQPLSYIYDNNLTSLTSGGICGVSTTNLAVNYCPNSSCTSPTTTISNVAFVALSSGSDLKIETFLNGTFNGAAYNAVIAGSGNATGNINIYDPSVQINSLPYDDVTRIVTLSELQARAHCAGVAGGRLTILNNELPRACTDTSYTAALYPAGGVPDASGNYQWCLNYGTPSLNGTILVAPTTPACTCNSNISHYCTACYCNPILSLTGAGPGTASPPPYPLNVVLSDYDPNSPAVVQRNYAVNVLTCGSTGGTGGTGASGGASSGNPTGGINTGATNSGASNSVDSSALSNNVAPSSGTTGLAVQNNTIQFGFNANNGAACIWYPYNFPLLGKTMRAFWNFCFSNIDNSANSTTYADGYTFSIMQANNPTNFCGTGNNDTAETPYDCQYGGALGEFLSYCGLPGNNMAVEFDIYPNAGRNDPAGSYNHVAVDRSLITHTGPPLAGTYGDNTHNVWGNPACGTNLNPACNGTCTGNCTGTCNGTAITNAPCTAAAPGTGTCYGTCTGTCNGSGLGCAYSAYDGTSHNYPVTWMEQSGCNSTYTDHNARVEVHTSCDAGCVHCPTNSCTSNALMKVWVDGNGGNGNNDLTADEPSVPDIAYCFTLPTSMSQVKIGFTEGTGASVQLGYISNFTANFFGSCTRPTISATSLPRITANSPWTATFSATGGLAPYTWSWSAANLTNPNPPPATISVPTGSSSTLPAGCTTSSINSSTGTISCTPTSAGPYNTVLVSVTDSCTTDTCGNTVSMNLSPTCSFSPNPVNVTYNTTGTLNFTITNGLANGTWTTSPGGTCINSNLTNKTGSQSCTTGNITASATYPLTVTNDFGSNTCSVTVNKVCPAPSITTSSLPNGTQNVAYTGATTVQASGGTTPYTWSATGLPPGLSIGASSGTISGTPTTAGTYTPTISVTDSCPGNTPVSQQFTIQIFGPPTCTLTPGSNIVAYNGNTSLTWSVANSATSATWTAAPSPIGTCGSPSASGGSCTTGSLTTPDTNTYTLRVSNAYGNNTCSATVYVGCAGYRVYNTTGAQYDFVINPGNTCRNNINNNNEITINPGTLLNPGGTLSRLTNAGTCGGTQQGQISYTNAMNADIRANGGNHNCQVNYGAGDTATDR